MNGRKLVVCGRSDVGARRDANQDRLLIAELRPEEPLALTAGGDGSALAGPVTLEPGVHGVALMVADGMGGRAGGERASRIAVDAVQRALASEIPAAWACADRLLEALVRANALIHEEGRHAPGLEGMGTTATLAGVSTDQVHVAHVGDSRAYMVRGDELIRLTRDQSLAQDMVDAGILGEDEARGVRNNLLHQALGVQGRVRPVVTSQALLPGDRLILCSDGLSQVVTDGEIAGIAASAHGSLETCDALVAAALAAGGPDNVTVLVATVS